MTRIFSLVTGLAKLSFLFCFSFGISCGHVSAEAAPCDHFAHFETQKAFQKTACDQCLKSEKAWDDPVVFSSSHVPIPPPPVVDLARWQLFSVPKSPLPVFSLTPEFQWKHQLKQQIRSIVLVI